MGLPQRDFEYHTYADYCRWPEDARYELIDGIAYAMSPAPTTRHQDVTGEIFTQLKNALRGAPCHPYIAPFDVRLPHANEADDDVDTVVQPDISVVYDPSKIDDKGCRGAPDWIIEVLSPSTAGHDMIKKKTIYERSGVREYWLVHPVDKVVTVFVLENGAYGKPITQELIGTTASSVLPNVVIEWSFVG